MADLTSLSHQLDQKKCLCRAIIETPKGCRNKFNYDPDSGLFTLAGLLPEGMMFPFDFGFIPSTLGEDGDPLDVLVLMDVAPMPGCILEARPVDAIEARQKDSTSGEWFRNDRLIAIAVNARIS